MAGSEAIAWWQQSLSENMERALHTTLRALQRAKKKKKNYTQHCRKLICKFKKTGNVADQPRSGPRRRATNEDAAILAAIIGSPRKSTRQLSAEPGVSRSSIRRIFKSKQMASIQIAYDTAFE